MKYFISYYDVHDDVYDIMEYDKISEVEEKIKQLLKKEVNKEDIIVIKGERLVFNEVKEKYLSINSPKSLYYTLVDKKRKSSMNFDNVDDIKVHIANKMSYEGYTVGDFEITKMFSYKCEELEELGNVVIMEGEWKS